MLVRVIVIRVLYRKVLFPVQFDIQSLGLSLNPGKHKRPEYG